MTFDKQQLNQLYRYCYMLTVHRDDAYDLLQSALEKYLKSPPNASYSEFAYIRRIIRNQFIDNIRRLKSVTFESLDSYAPHAQEEEHSYFDNQDVIAINSSALDEMLINEERVEWIWSILNAAEREIVFLWGVEGYTAAEVATELDMPRGTVLSKIHRLRKKITTNLTEDAVPVHGKRDGKRDRTVAGIGESR